MQQKIILQKTIADNIKKYRLKTGKSISLISNEIGISKSIWSDLEAGVKDPQFSTLWRVAEALDVPLSKIISNVEKELKNKISFFE